MRVGVAVVLGAWLAFSVVEAAEKKGKEIPTQICKRGKLIFEDDFSGKDILWRFDEKECQYAILKGALVTKSNCGAVRTWLTRQVTPVRSLIIELRVFLPKTSQISVSSCVVGQTIPVVSGIVAPSEKIFYLKTWTEKDGNTTVSTGAFAYPKPRWVSVLSEAFEGNYAFTVEGKTIRWTGEAYERTLVTIAPSRPASSEPLAIDDVKVWEALPKDEAPEKDEKDKNKR